jgi:uncharacterized Zn finger protein
MSWGYYSAGPRKQVVGGVVVAKPGRVSREEACALVQQAEYEATPGILGRARTYARAGQVVAVAVATREFTAQVQGTGDDPYEVALRAITISGSPRADASCNCPYGCDFGWCKHAAALAYVAAHLLESDESVRAAWAGAAAAESSAEVPVAVPVAVPDTLLAGLRRPAPQVDAPAMIAAAAALVPRPWDDDPEPR